MMTAFARTIILYFLIMVGLRLMGKRQIGELEPSELVLAMMISDLATVPMQDFGIPLLAGVIPILTLLAISMLLSHQIGVLSNVLNRLSALGVNVLTISQSMPIHGTANVVMTLDIAQLSGSLENAIAALGAMRGVENAMLVSIE